MESKGVVDPQEIDSAFAAVNQDASAMIKYSEFVAAAIEARVLYETGRVEAVFRRLDIDDSVRCEGRVDPDAPLLVRPALFSMHRDRHRANGTDEARSSGACA